MKVIRKKYFWKDKNKQKLEAIKDHGEKYLNSIENQNKNKLKAIEKDDKLVYLRDGINKLLEIIPFINSLEVFARNDFARYCLQKLIL